MRKSAKIKLLLHETILNIEITYVKGALYYRQSEFQLFEVLNELSGFQKPTDLASGFSNIGGYALIREKLKGLF